MKEMFKKISSLLKKRKVTSDAAPRSPRRTSPAHQSSSQSSSDSSDSDDLSIHEEWTKSKPKKHKNGKKNGTKNGKKNNPKYGNGHSVKIVISDSTHTHIGHNYYINDQKGAKNVGQPEAEVESEEEIQVPSDQLDDAMNSYKQVTEEELMSVKGMIGNGLPALCDLLGVMKSRMEQLLAEYKPREEATYRILLEWKQQNGRIATVGILSDSLWKAKEYDAAESLAHAYTLRTDRQW